MAHDLSAAHGTEPIHRTATLCQPLPGPSACPTRLLGGLPSLMYF
jgi:hypothetical protein